MQHAWGRAIVRRAATQAASAARRRASSKVFSAVSVSLKRSAVAPALAQCGGAARFESSSSRFLSLADDDDDEKRKRKGRRDDDDGDDEDEEEEEEDENEQGEGFEDTEGVDGDVEFDEAVDINEGGVEEDEEVDEAVMALFLENPLKWTPEKLAHKFYLSKPRVESIIWFKREEAEMSPEEFRDKIKAAKQKAQQELDAFAKQIAQAEAAGDEKEVTRLKKRERQAAEAELPDQVLDAHEEAMLMGIDEDAFQNPDFFFLSDEFEGYPPLVRRMGKHGHTDQLYPEEALQLQKMAVNNKIEPLKSFANPSNSKSKAKFRLAVKDITTKKKHLLVRDESRTLRLATDEEVLPRTWVRRPAFFRGLDKELS
ncbi:hypothetical protein BBJ28_00020904 [Nothophytophthora sp. Chile5]|nr:hypothetical protein BBJ28_00020904 [Nothophytophthora sp. Chile5]